MTREHFDPEWKKALEAKKYGTPEYKAAVEEQERVKKAFISVAETPEGRTMFKALMNELGFKGTTIDGKSVDNTHNMLCNEARRRVWIQLRAIFPVDLRNSIEQDEV